MGPTLTSQMTSARLCSGFCQAASRVGGAKWGSSCVAFISEKQIKVNFRVWSEPRLFLDFPSPFPSCTWCNPCSFSSSCPPSLPPSVWKGVISPLQRWLVVRGWMVLRWKAGSQKPAWIIHVSCRHHTGQLAYPLTKLWWGDPACPRPPVSSQ